MVILALAAGCSPSGVDSDDENSRNSRLVIGNWPDYLSDEVVEVFTESTGIQVEIRTYSSIFELMSELQADPAAYDLAVIDDSVLNAMLEYRMVRKFNQDLIPNLEHIDPEHRHIQSNPGGDWWIPYAVGITLLGYRKDHINPPPESWSALWDPRFKGRVALLDDGQENTGVASLALGQPVDSDEPEHLATVATQIHSLIPSLAGVHSIDILLELLDSGEIWICPVYSMDVAMLARENEDVGYVIPDEGAILWIDGFVMPRDARNVAAAHRFINFLNQPEIAARNANNLLMLPSNLAATEMLDDRIRDDSALNPDAATRRKLQLFKPPTDAITFESNRLMEAIHRALTIRDTSSPSHRIE
ncbi:MAG: spermidine/putrescine ABC transporter substrate-binding protein [Kiritimatiellae bacterium]|jgi:spermidine/putrescine transport system substrate-binding protein|nr:spermidine/putrescine ABC transporter substrate-binding protein [Kiritimatiellia bacterium]